MGLLGDDEEYGDIVRAADGRVAVVGPDGHQALVPLGELDAAIKEFGFRLATPAEHRDRVMEAKYGDKPVDAAVLGALRAVTFGLSDAAVSGVEKAFDGDGSGTELFRETAARNKVATVAGEVAGYMSPIGAGAAIGRAGAAAARGVGGGAAGLAARG